MRQIDHLIAGGAGGSAGRSGEVFDPNNGTVQAKVAFGTGADLERAVGAAQAAQPGWAATNPQRRAKVMFRFRELVERDLGSLAHLLASEHGKVIADARGDVMRGLDVIEFAGGIPHGQMGACSPGAGPGIDV
jgi:malonate-semialdehyde dehydrogenase (acetylating)/methylmalonate-semialdehyde dehydrogenase